MPTERHSRFIRKNNLGECQVCICHAELLVNQAAVLAKLAEVFAI